jgi:hypothetical protein
MNCEFVACLLKTVGAQLPDFLMPLIGVALSIYFFKRNPGKFRLTIIAFSIFFLITFGYVLFIAWQSESPVNDSQLGLLGFNCLTGITLPAAWILIVVSIFHPRYAADGNSVSTQTPPAALPVGKTSQIKPILGYIGLGILSVLVSLIASLFTFGWIIRAADDSPGTGFGLIVILMLGVPLWITIAILSPIVARWIFKGPSGRWLRILFSFLLPILTAVLITALITGFFM